MATTRQIRAEVLGAIIEALEVFCGCQVVGVVGIDDRYRVTLFTVGLDEPMTTLVMSEVGEGRWNAPKSL